MHQTGTLGFFTTLIGLLAVIGVGFVASHTALTEPQPVLSVGLALGTGGLGDRAFNDDAYGGLQQAQQAYGIRFRIVEWQGNQAQVTNLRSLAQECHDLVIAVGQEYVPIIEQVALEYPQQRFALVDAQAEAPNLTSVTFRELEGDFLAGALAALISSSDVIGFLGGADIPVIRRIRFGWTQGVRYINPDAQILVYYASGQGDFSGFNKPELGLELATEIYESQADVIYTPAGRTALGAITAAEQQQRLVITTGSDQRWIAPEVVVTSRMKQIDTAVFTLITELQAGTLQPGMRVLDLQSGGVGLAPLSTELVPLEVRIRLEAIAEDLDRGAIVVREYPLP